MEAAPPVVRLPYPVSANRYWRKFRGFTVVSSEARAYRRETVWMAKLAGVKPVAGDVCVSITLHPKTTASGAASRTRIDLDNAIKVLLDALIGAAYIDDKQVVKIYAEIGEPVKDGGCSVQVLPMGQGGIPAVLTVPERPAPPNSTGTARGTSSITTHFI